MPNAGLIQIQNSEVAAICDGTAGLPDQPKFEVYTGLANMSEELTLDSLQRGMAFVPIY